MASSVRSTAPASRSSRSPPSCSRVSGDIHLVAWWSMRSTRMRISGRPSISSSAASRRPILPSSRTVDPRAPGAGAGLALFSALLLAGAASAAPARAPRPARAVRATTTVAPPAPAAGLRLSLADAVRLAAGESPAAKIAALRSLEAGARGGQSRGALLPSLTGSASTSNRTFNLKAQGIPFPAIPGVAPFPDVIGPIDNVDVRLRVTQTVVDLPSWQKWRAAGFGARAGRADEESAAEAAAQAGALAWLRAARAEALVSARQQDLALAAELLHLAREQQAAGVSPAIDTTRASTQVAVSRGELLVAENQ